MRFKVRRDPYLTFKTSSHHYVIYFNHMVSRSTMWFKVNRLVKVNHGIKFKETHNLQSFLYDIITAGRHLGRTKDDPVYSCVPSSDERTRSWSLRFS